MNIDRKQLRALIQKGYTDAQKLLAMGMNVNALRTNATLRHEEWQFFDKAIIKAARDRLVGIQRLRAMGLVLTLTNGLGQTVLKYEDASDVEGAQVSMDGVTRGRFDRVEFDMNYMPLPMIHADYQLGIRELNASRNLGESLDTTMAELKGRKVAEQLEEHMFQGTSSFTYGGGTIYGLQDAPNANTGSLAVNWDDSAATGLTILEDVKAMKQAELDAKHYGPFDLFVPGNYEVALDNDYVGTYPKTRRERILELASVNAITIADYLSDDYVVMVQMTNDTIRQVEGLPMTNLEWNEQGGMVFNFKIMTISLTQVRADQDGNSGICVWT